MSSTNKDAPTLRARIASSHWKMIAVGLMIFDFFAIHFSYFFGLWIRFDFKFSSIPEKYLDAFIRITPIYTCIAIVFFWFMNMYRSVWRFVGVGELFRYVASSLIAATAHAVAITAMLQRMPFSYYIVGAVTQTLLIVCIRFSYRFYLTISRRRLLKGTAKDTKRVMIIGAGAAGQSLMRELSGSDKLDVKVCCIIDDNPNKHGRFIEGVPVAGGRNDIRRAVEKYAIDAIYFSIPTATPAQRRDILNICDNTSCELKSLPGLYQLVTGEVLISRLKPVAVEDLLGREPIRVNMNEIFAFIKGKVILVTGGGGSIGSELCRQLAVHSPAHLIIFDIYENNAYEIEQELRRNFPDLKLTVLIGSVRDSRRIFGVFEKYRPEVVYHAAAHKHVPLMEVSPAEAIKNNVLGTYKTACAALQYGCSRFVLISTDKAVNPTNIMGASKRLCEMVIQSMDRISKAANYSLLKQINMHCVKTADSAEPEFDPSKLAYRQHSTEFVAVRFGNVLGSNGSVIPLFKKQIAEGGPVTVTHPDIIRYFMTIPEAVNLVLQASFYAAGGEIFVLDMGEPVKIDTLARNLIKLSGYKPDEDIKIVYSGLRPGEKLYEEKLMAEEGMKSTPNKLIHIGNPIPFDEKEFFHQLAEIAEAAYSNSDSVCALVKKAVPTFRHD